MSKANTPLTSNAKSRTADFLRRIEAGKSAIEADVEKHEGIYPFNGGRLSIEEVCRRARIHAVSLHGPLHKDTTLKDLQRWLDDLLADMAVGKKEVRKAVTQRADDWQQRFLDQANWVHRYHVLEAARLEELRAANVRISQLEAEVLRLKEQVAPGKVVSLRKRG